MNERAITTAHLEKTAFVYLHKVVPRKLRRTSKAEDASEGWWSA